MLNLRLQNNESIQIPINHPIYVWSSVLQSKKERNNPKLNLKKYEKRDVELVIRIVELLALSKNNMDFLKNLNVLSAAMDETQIKSALSLIHLLNIVPTNEFISSKNIPHGYTLANYIAPIMVFSSKCYNLAEEKNKQKGGGNGENMVNPLTHLM